MDKLKKSKTKEVYIVRIFRRSSTPGESLVGIIEDVIQKKSKIFKTEEELIKILSDPVRFLHR